MSNTIRIKRSNTENAVPTLVYGELGLRVRTSGNGPRLYYGDASGNSQDAKGLIPAATVSTTGLASFATADFEVTAGGEVDIKPLGVSNAQLAGSITNAKLSNSSVTVGSTAISLGNAATSLAGMVNIDCSAGNRAIYSSLGSGNTLSLGTTGSTVKVMGNLLVEGDSVTQNVATITVEDPQMELAKGNTGDSMDIGIYGKYVSSGTKFTGIFRDATDGVWKVYDSLDLAPSVTNGTVITTAQENYAQGDFSAKIVSSEIDCGTF